MPKGIGVSPGIVVGVAHLVESNIGSNEPQTLDGAHQVAAEIDRFDLAVSETAEELVMFVDKVAQELGASRRRNLQEPLADCQRPRVDLASSPPDRESAPDTHSALQVVMQGYAAQFARMQQDFFRDRMTESATSF